MKYIIYECGLPTICRPPPGRYLLGRYTYTGLQHFLGQAQLLYGMCAEKRNMSNKYTYLTIISPPSQTALPINHQRVHCKTSFFSYSYIILYKYCLFLRRNRRRRCGTVVRKCCSSSLPASATRRRLGFLRNGSSRPKKKSHGLDSRCMR